MKFKKNIGTRKEVMKGIAKKTKKTGIKKRIKI